MQVTDEDPDVRLPLLQTALSQTPDTNVSFKTIEANNYEYFMYMIMKE